MSVLRNDRSLGITITTLYYDTNERNNNQSYLTTIAACTAQCSSSSSSSLTKFLVQINSKHQPPMTSCGRVHVTQETRAQVMGACNYCATMNSSQPQWGACVDCVMFTTNTDQWWWWSSHLTVCIFVVCIVVVVVFSWGGLSSMFVWHMLASWEPSVIGGE